jgi:hypothetical protein
LSHIRSKKESKLGLKQPEEELKMSKINRNGRKIGFKNTEGWLKDQVFNLS